MSSTGLLVASPAPFSTDASARALSEYPGLYPTNDPLGLWLDLDRSLPSTLPWNGEAGITWGNPDKPDNTTSEGTQENQQRPLKFEKPGNAEKEPQTQMIRAPHCRRRSTANATDPDFQTKPSQRERFLESNRLAANRCRQKKKEHTQHLETRLHDEAQKKRQLEGDITGLRDEILGLKDEILKHALCEDGRAGQHLAHMMQQTTQGNTAGASSSLASASSPVSASLVTATSPAATAANLQDGSSPGVSYVDEGISGDINGETLSLGSDTSYPSVEGTVAELIDAYTFLT